MTHKADTTLEPCPNVIIKPTVHGYKVTSDGRVISTKTNWRGLGTREMCQHNNDSGYPMVQLTSLGKRKTYRVHQLVCAAFHGEKPFPEAQVRHLDGSRENNHSSNLCWGSPSENACDRVKHGRQFGGMWDDPEWAEKTRQKIRDGISRRKTALNGGDDA